jgi:hypothetical protein
MPLNREKLENVVGKVGGGYTARCPACALVGCDRCGVHLFVHPSGGYACITGDRKHQKLIYRIAGEHGRRRLVPRPVVVHSWRP